MILRLPYPVVWTAAALAAISLGVAAGPVVWRLTGDSGQPVGAAAAAAPAPQAARLDLGPILSFAPFGSAVAPQAAPQVIGETGLGLTLLGVTIATPSTRSRAIIAGGEGGRTRSYAIGAEVTATATLSQVTQTHVVLLVGGQFETLSFAKPGSRAKATGKTDLRNLIGANAGTNTGTSGAPAASNDPDAVIARYRAAILQNPQTVMDRLGLEATGDGYRISDAASPGVRQAGFRPGDLVTMVNGQTVGDIAADQRYFDEVAASGKARVELLRDGQSIVMTFPLR